MITIIMKNGKTYYWTKDGYDEYEYKNKVFVVKKCDQWVGIYNMDEVSAIEINRNEIQDILERHYYNDKEI